jgi:hypothetical protein
MTTRPTPTRGSSELPFVARLYYRNLAQTPEYYAGPQSPQAREQAQQRHPRTPALPRKKKASPFFSVMGQCGHCHDHFDVTLYRAQQQIFVQETQRLKWNPQTQILHHRPDVCNGEVSLYGSLETR